LHEELPWPGLLASTTADGAGSSHRLKEKQSFRCVMENRS